MARSLVRRWRFDQLQASPGSRAGVRGAMDWLTAATYQLTEYLIVEDELEAVLDRLQQHQVVVPADPRGAEVFRLTINAIFAHEPGSLSDSQKERVIKRCWHAYRHYIPHSFLAAFFKQIPSGQLRSRIASGAIEHQFRWWVISQMAFRRGEPSERGDYPPEIVRDAKRLSKTLRREGPEHVHRYCVLP